MHSGQRYSLKEFLLWTRRDNVWLLAIAVIPTAAFVLLDWRWLAVPWVPVALVGTAAAFIVGFRNNATYARAWEARQIYGAIVNSSRAWGIAARDFIQVSEQLSRDDAQSARQQLIHRHIAWLTALRYQLRQPRAWETMSLPHNLEYQQRHFAVAERQNDLEAQLVRVLSPSDAEYVLAKSNRATQLLAQQSAHILELYRSGAFEHNHRVALERILFDLYDHQGKCERIKNFPYPRQFATINLFFIRLLQWLVPLGLLGEFSKQNSINIWMTVPFSFLIGWVFNALERVGESTENPFEGNANDVPITSLSRTIEIDLREMLDERDIPAPISATNNILL
jgi:ion channel-forming bestrophin family protein